MRRDTRRRTDNQNWWEDKRVLLGGSAVTLLLAIIGVVSIYSGNSGKSETKKEINPNQIISLAPEEENKDSTESASSSIGNKVENTQAETNTNVSNNASTNTNTNSATKANVTNTNAKETAEKIKQNKTEETTKNETAPTSNEAKSEKNTTFDWPVKGDILKAFSVDNLLYSSTLQEWTVHNGIDIKADKTTVVYAAEDGTVKSIKNDPRYGLTVVIEHANGFKTVYSNLLTAEFVVEGEKVSKGQSIGTVGNTANFEVADDFHLHFEVLKDDEYVDPMVYLK